MADFELSGLLELDASEYIGGAEEASDASEELGDSTEETSESLFDLEPAGVAAGAALAGIGTAAQDTLDDTQSLRETLGRTATSTELTRGETTDLATEMSNATFPIEDVTATMDELAQAGIESEDTLRETAMAADSIADATGNSAETIASDAVPALKAMGGDASDLGEEMDTFTFVARETQMSVSDFSRIVTKTGPELRDMGLSVEDTAAIMTSLEERGLDSRTAMREFRQAAREADGDQAALMSSLELTSGELNSQRQALEQAEGSTRKHAAAANESLSATDRLRAGFDDIQLKAAEMLGPIDAVAPAMQAAGVAAIGLSTINTSALIPSITGILTAMGPLLPIIAAVGAAVAALAVAWETDFLGIRDITKKAFGAIESAISATIGRVQSDVVEPALSALDNLWSAHGETITSAVTGAFDAIESAIDATLGVIKDDIIDPILTAVENLWSVHGESIGEDVSALYQGLKDTVDSTLGFIMDSVIKPILDTIESFWGSHGDAIKSTASDAFGFVKSTVRDVFTVVSNIIEQAGDTILTVIDATLSVLRGDFGEAFDELEGLVDRTLDRIIESLTNWPIISELDTIMSGVLDVGQEIFDGLVDVFSGVANAIGETLRTAFNEVVPDKIELPSVTVGGQSISTEIAGQEIGGSLPEVTVGGGSFDLPQLETGGLIDRGGLAELHAGERVVPSSQVSDRGEVEFNADEVVDEIRQLRQAVENGRSVREADIVRALERLFDRHGGSI